jgi:hypothetical protein
VSRDARNSTEVLQAAKWILENVGWVKKSYQKSDDSGKIIAFCAEGALWAVETGTYGIRNRAMNRLEKVLKERIVVFNDNKKTTKQMVINAFNRAIKKGAK